MVTIETGSTADVDAVADLWVVLADSQREFDSHLLSATNRENVRETVVRRAVSDELLVARGDDEGDDSKSDDETGHSKSDDEGDDSKSDDETGHSKSDDETGHSKSDDETDHENSDDEEAYETGDSTDPESAGRDIVGFLTFGVETGRYEVDATRGVVQNVFVVPDRRGEGIGSALLGAAERRLAEAGADVVALEVMADNADARRFYRQHGYGPHRVEMEKSVESDTLTKE